MSLKKNKYVYIKKYAFRNRDKNIGNLDDFRNDIITLLGDDIFEYETLDEIIYNSLRIIYPINKNLRNDESSVLSKSYQVLEHFGLNRTLKANLYRIGDNGEHIPIDKKEPNLTPKDKYLNEIIRLKDLPKTHFDYLKEESEYHLLEITKLVTKYSNTTFISKNYLKEERPPSNQKERMLLDYYKRCIAEQQDILAYIYGNKIRDRAISKATKMPFNLSAWNLGGIFDFPYYSSRVYSEGYFNHESIEKVYHRLVDTTVYEEDKNYRNLYFNNKRLFYSKLFKEYPTKQYFKDIGYYIEVLPITQQRKRVINELEFLFKKQKWISFYGITLTQIEGLFADMSTIMGAKVKRRIYDKINAVRESDILNYLDYYQYHIPQMRNKFMHGELNGLESDKLNSYDLLTDIRFLLKFFYELDNPLVQLKKILAKQSYIFPTFNEIVSFFKILDDNNSSLKEYVKNNLSEIRHFLHLNLVANKNIDVLVINLEEDINNNISRVTEFLNRIFSKNDIDLDTYNPKTIKSFFENAENNILLKSEIFLIGNEIETISECALFMKKYKKWLTGLEQDIAWILEDMSKNYSSNLNKLSVLLQFKE
ncbi:hypothetical protein [Aquimarina sp. RZ0]|uniref:hypothetical protein n=1 Tax=Aquimarina sp. RZ0 TaxID=2607730 RepID=UPI0011F1C165|nr:hypothetical protein [Aquimarina sp. RZ0]KAA1242597.1 hypothetical protein F0000_24935 [Aquimarina sp. RZ0]